MATQSRPLMNKGVALASAAAIAAATPAIMPTLDVPTHALATAEVQLANFADVMSVPAGVWSDILFSNDAWGGILSGGVYGPEWAAPQTVFLQPGYVNPWAGFCDNQCFVSGPSGVAYLFFDALINGDGSGFENSEDWKVGFVNYLFEPNAVFQIGGGSSPGLQFVNSGLSSGSWYALQGTIGQVFPQLTVPIASLYYGTLNLSVAYNLVGVVAALALNEVPLIGPFLGNSILAYLGDLQIPGTVEPNALFYQFGLSGTLNYWVDILSGAAPFPTGSNPPAASLAAAAVPVSATASATSAALKSDIAEATEAAAPEASPAVEVDASPAVEVEASPAVEVEASPAVEVAPVEVAEATPAVEVADAGPVVEASESVATSAPDLPAVEVADIAAVKAPKRPVRSAVERVAKSVRSALGATKADNAGSNAVSPGSPVGSVGSVGSAGSGSTASESAGSDAGSADSDAGSASSDAGSADSEG